jgi:LysM repeat protein
MAGGDQQRRGLAGSDHYLDLVDLYAARATRAKTVVAHDAKLPVVHPIGRSERLTIRAARSSAHGFRSRRIRIASAVTAVLLVFSVLAGTALADQQYRVRDGDTITIVGERFGVDPVAILEASGLDNPEYLYPGQELTIPGIADGELGTGWVLGTYEVVYGDTIGSIAWNLHVSASDLLEINGLSADAIIYPGQVLVVPDTPATKEETLAQLDELSSEQVTGESEVAAAETVADQAATAELPSQAWVAVPTYVQRRNLSCEYASTYIATAAFGPGIDESTFWSSIPVTQNPHYGYRGDIDGWWGNYTDYGIYPEPLVPVLNANGYGGEVFYGESDPTYLMQQLAWGRPVVVWLAMWGDTGIRFDDEGSYTIFSGEHVMTAYGYDETGVYLSDPATGGTKYYDWATFLWMWGTSDGMSLAVYPL